MTSARNITLRQGLDQFYKENTEYLSHNKKGISTEARSFFESHDVAHVLFGCDLTLFGEGSVKIWTIFGTTLGFWKHIKGYKEVDALELSRDFSFTHIVNNIFKFLLSIPVLIIRAKRMHKPWSWTGYESYLDTPIAEIREEFNIHVL
ncbi:MAG: hypothetical protein KJP00_09565 [Bacteroidia bacterium]|nr:hypothetical protein [Bacteroidia bacterium]